VLFDLSIGKLLVLAVIAVVIFGPDQLPKVAAQAGRALRELRRLADGARDDLREGLGPEFSDFDIADLHPRNFVRKHLLDDVDGMTGSEPLATVTGTAPVLAPGESPPYDPEAT
jgi:sec-independent protein translocase protein TatB